VLGPVDDGDVAMGGRWELGARCRGCWGLSTSVTWQLHPGSCVLSGLVFRQREGGSLTWVARSGCLLLLSAATAVVGGESREWEETTDVARDRHIK